MSGRNAPISHDTEEIVKDSISDKTLAEVARNLGIHENLLRGWCKNVQEIEALPDTNESKNDQIRRLRAEHESVKEDNEILKKASAYFARHQR